MFPNADGYAIGSIEGRVAIQYVLFVPLLLLFVKRTSGLYEPVTYVFRFALSH